MTGSLRHAISVLVARITPAISSAILNNLGRNDRSLVVRVRLRPLSRNHIQSLQLAGPVVDLDAKAVHGTDLGSVSAQVTKSIAK